MNDFDNAEPLLDLLYQTMFTVTKKGYSPKEVDMFIEELKDECRMWNEKYKELQKQFLEQQQLLEQKKNIQWEEDINGRYTDKKAGD